VACSRAENRVRRHPSLSADEAVLASSATGVRSELRVAPSVPSRKVGRGTLVVASSARCGAWPGHGRRLRQGDSRSTKACARLVGRTNRGAAVPRACRRRDRDPSQQGWDSSLGGSGNARAAEGACNPRFAGREKDVMRARSPVLDGGGLRFKASSARRGPKSERAPAPHCAGSA